MSEFTNIESIRQYFAEKLKTFGPNTYGMDWNSIEAQEVRFAMVCQVIDASQYSLTDYGCGYGALVDFLLNKGHKLSYQGFDIVDEAIQHAQKIHANRNFCRFTTQIEALTSTDYVVSSGIFNIRHNASDEQWFQHIITTLHHMNQLADKGFAFNCLTKYSDKEYKRPGLYYADPLLLFDYCKRNFARNVALLHDYGIYDFTILVRKERD